ncbi:LLM class flavin-dependent oxidoreductase [Nocardia gipuzkoensis]
MSPRLFRFGVVAISAVGGKEWTATAQWAEDAGFSALLVPDLPPPVSAPLTALAFAAAATTRLEVGTWVLANDFRNPVVVAREAATLDPLSGGRFRLGLGAGQPANGYGDLRVTVESGAIRVERLAESVRIVNALFRGERVHLTGTHYASAGPDLLPPPRRKVPLLIASGGRRATELAAAEVGYRRVQHLLPGAARPSARVAGERRGRTVPAPRTGSALQYSVEHHRTADA